MIRRRRMVRDFADRPLEPAMVERIVASALRAPSAGFAQGWAFLVLTEPADVKRFWPFAPNQTKHTPGMTNAPLVIIPLANKDQYLARYAAPDKGWQDQAEAMWPAPYWFIDTGMATMMMLLSAIDEGLGAFFFWLMPATPKENQAVEIPKHLQKLREEFGIPDEYFPIGAIAIGYRAADLAPQRADVAERRRSADQVVHRGQWGRQDASN